MLTIRSVWRVLRSRAWLLILPACLAADFSALPHRPWEFSHTKVAVFGRPHYRGTAHGRPLPGSLVERDGHLDWVWPWEDAGQSPPTKRSRMETLTVFIDMERRSGLYHITEGSREIKVHGDNPTPDDLAALHALLLHELLSDPELQHVHQYDLLPALQSGGWSYTRRIREGHARDHLALGIAAAWILLLLAHAGAWAVGRTTAPSLPLTAA